MNRLVTVWPLVIVLGLAVWRTAALAAFPYGAALTTRFAGAEIDVQDEAEVPAVSESPASDSVVRTTCTVDLAPLDEAEWAVLREAADADDERPIQYGLTMRRSAGGENVWTAYAGGAWRDLAGPTPAAGRWTYRIDIDRTADGQADRVRYAVRAEAADDFTDLTLDDEAWLAIADPAESLTAIRLLGEGAVASADVASGQRPPSATLGRTESVSLDCSSLTLQLDVSDAWCAERAVVTLRDAAGAPVKSVEKALAAGLNAVTLDGLSSGSYTCGIVLAGHWRGAAIASAEQTFPVTLASAAVKPQGGKISLDGNGSVDLFGVKQGAYAVERAAGKTCHLKWTDAYGRYAVLSDGTLTVREGAPANGEDSFVSHVLGLDPARADSRPYVKAVQIDDPTKVRLSVAGISPRAAAETGVAVSYDLVSSSNPQFAGIATEQTSAEPSFLVPLAELGKLRYYKVNIRLRAEAAGPEDPVVDATEAGNVFLDVFRVATPETSGYSVKLEGNRLYFGAGRTLYVFDVSVPTLPRLMGSCSGIGSVRQLTAENGIVYIATRETGLWIVDATDPFAPQVVTRFDAVELGTGIDVCGGVVMLGQRQYGVEFIDARDPAKPEHIRLEKTSESQSTCFYDGFCYSGDWGMGELTVFSAADMASVAKLAVVKLHGYGDGVDAFGDRIYVSTGHHYRHPNQAGNWVADSTEGSADYGLGHAVEIFDIRDRANPVALGRCAFGPFYRSGMDMWRPRVNGDGRHVFCADTYNGLYAVDVTDAANPQIVGRITVPYADPGETAASHPVTGVEVGDGAVYLTASGAGLVVATCPLARRRTDVKSPVPANPDYRTNYDRAYSHLQLGWKPSDQGQVRSVAAYGTTHLYVAAGHAGLAVLDSDLREVRRLDVPFCGDVKVRGSRLYSAEGRTGLAVYDLADPDNPALVRRDTTFGYPLASNTPIWLMAPAGTDYLALSEHGAAGYAFYRDGAELSKQLTRVSAGVGWDKYLSDDVVNGLWALNMRGTVSWIDLSGDNPVVTKMTDEMDSSMNAGSCAFSGGRYLMPGTGYFYYVPAGATSMSEATRAAIPNKRSPGQVVWNGSTRVAMVNRIQRTVRLYDMTDETQPAELWSEEVASCPERPVFFSGKLVVPCGYAGVLVEK